LIYSFATAISINANSCRIFAISKVNGMDWEDLKTFVAVAKGGTVRRAAVELKVHHATVGRRIASLEASVGARLFDRRPEGLSLTTAGEDLLTVASKAGAEFRSVQRRISDQETEAAGRVTVSTGEPVAEAIIMPGLPDFAARFPDLDMHVETTWSIADLSRGDADIAVRADNNPPDALVGKRLFPYFETVYASPAYLEAFGERAAGNPGRWIGWGGSGISRPGWVENGPLADTKVWGGIASLSSQVAAARAGLGFVALPCFIGDKAAGLSRVEGAGLHRGRDVWLLTHPDLKRTRRIRVTMDFLEDRLRTARDLFLGQELERG
jgi:DNA-binding transcriptional LysR family regulator